ncbi:hypothetical protein Y032_0024g1056 [Ancylostoma ceylanicum]|uniref:Uncharacterized protein n=1 Tax=Ancylostoma ceylanicum TaxID=53326 RepID=A0A016UVZ2_9BILA|nr:hypothetical protein Y032_0024g1056 [Ancylostoma ceylanicum]
MVRSVTLRTNNEYFSKCSHAALKNKRSGSVRDLRSRTSPSRSVFERGDSSNRALVLPEYYVNNGIHGCIAE